MMQLAEMPHAQSFFGCRPADVSATARSLSPWPRGPSPAIQAIHQGQQEERNHQQNQGGLVGTGIIKRLNFVINIDRNCPRDAGDIASHHKYDSEFTQGMSKA